jgi:RNA polymerase sigma factor (sigma-70 family)
VCHLALDDVVIGDPGRPDVVALNDALLALERLDERKAKVVELRFFGGLTLKETAEVLHVSTETVMRDWNLARAWLLRELKATSSE